MKYNTTLKHDDKSVRFSNMEKWKFGIQIALKYKEKLREKIN